MPLPEWQGPNPTRATWGLKYPDGSRFGIELRPARPESRERRYDRYEPGPHHIALHAASREVVDQVHAAMLAVGATVLDAPADYSGDPAYGEGYYAVFFSDPDGNQARGGVHSAREPLSRGGDEMQCARWFVCFVLAGALTAQAGELVIPESIRHEHEEIHGALVEATRLPGPVGAAAKALAEVLLPHFVREEEIALPPLGLIAPLASGAPISGAASAEALAMTDALRRELPRMLEEHVRIRAAVAKLREVARAEKAEKQIELANALAVHARTEEQVLYPAALLVGDSLRAR